MGLTHSQLLDAVETATVNSRASSEIMAALATQGVTEADLAEGEALLKTAQLKAGAQAGTVQSLRLLTPQFEAAQNKARAEYQDLVGACRAELSPAQIKALQIREMPQDAVRFVQAATALLDAIPRNAEIQAALAKRKRHASRLAQVRQAVEDYDKKAKEMKLLKGAQKQATSEQTKAIQELNTWFVRFSRFARLGLKQKKALLDQILPQARKTAPKEAATTPAAK